MAPLAPAKASVLPQGTTSEEIEHLLRDLFRLCKERVPAYQSLSAETAPAEAPNTLHDLLSVAPLLTKESYIAKYPLPLRCLDGDIARLHQIHTSTGSTGTPTMWGRTTADELAIARCFQQIFVNGFETDKKPSTLAVICFPMGGWVGGVFTTMCMRHLAQQGLRITVVTPGNNIPEILKFVIELGPFFAQTVLLGYPPFVKGVIETGIASGVPWEQFDLKLVLAGEVFSERWRALVAERASIKLPQRAVVSIYGTADAGVLACETPLSAVVRVFLEAHPDKASTLFGKERLPSLMQYDPATRFIEFLEQEGTLAISCLCSPDLEATGAPLLRYSIGDAGGVLGFSEMLQELSAWGFDALSAVRQMSPSPEPRQLPFVWVFGRKHWTVSLYGANVYVENVMLGVEQEEVCRFLTGKFVLEVEEDEHQDVRLAVTAELTPGASGEVSEDSSLLVDLEDKVARSIEAKLLEVNSEYSNYVPPEKQRPKVALLPYGDPVKFPVGTKHVYIQAR